MASTTLLERALGAAAKPPRDDAASERILDAVLELVAASGLRALTMDAVAARAGVGRMTVYRRFGERDRLIDALAARETRRCLAALDAAAPPDAPIAEQVAVGFATSLRLIRTHPVLERFARHEPEAALAALNAGGAALFVLAREFVAARLRQAQAAGGLDAAVDPEQAAELLIRLGFSFLVLPRSAVPLDEDEAARALARRLIAPILGG